jgi:DNA-binding protein H-NS
MQFLIFLIKFDVTETNGGSVRSFSEIQAEIVEYEGLLAALQQEAKEAQAREVGEARKKIAELMKSSGITAEELLGRTIDKAKILALKPKEAKAPLPPVYENPETKETWSGRGRCPAWLVDKDRTKFLIRAAG